MSFKRFRRILVRLLTVVVILATAGSIGLYGYRAVFGYHYDSSLSDADLSAGIQADENITNIALFGLDTRPGDEKSHSDCMMIVTIDNTRGKIKLSSLMRDSLVEIDGVGEDKLNAAYFRGGPSLAIRTINENFGTDIEDYIAVNFEQVVEIVDALDGIEINVASEAELTELNRVIRDYGLEQGKEFSPVEKTGLQTLDGVQALCYGRIRKGNTGDDWSRVERQSVVLNAMFAKISSMDANGLLGIMNRLMPYVTTSLAPADIAPLIVGAVKNGVPAVEHVRFPLDGEWKYYGSSNEYIMYGPAPTPAARIPRTAAPRPASRRTAAPPVRPRASRLRRSTRSRSSRRAAATTPPPAIIMTRTETDTIWTKTAIGCIINK